MQKRSNITLRLYSRSYCHLCEDMLNALMRLKPKYGFEIDILDVDQDPVLLARYDEMVPVLAGLAGFQDERYLCHYHIDHEQVIRFLEGPAQASQ